METQKRVRTLRKKKCKVCHSEYSPMSSLQVACSIECAIKYARISGEKKERLQKRINRQKLKSRGDYVKEAQTSFNAYIRARDISSGLPCISCGRFHTGQYHAGHYRATSVAPALRFEEINVHMQCQPCNTHLHGNLIEYRINLIKKIGLEKVEWLEGPHEPKKYSIQELIEIKKLYQQKLKELKK